MDELIKKEKISTTVGRKLSICIGKFDTCKSKWLMDRSLKYNIWSLKTLLVTQKHTFNKYFLHISEGFGSEAAIIIVLGFVQSYTVASILLVIGEGFAGFGIAGMCIHKCIHWKMLENDSFI